MMPFCPFSRKYILEDFDISKISLPVTGNDSDIQTCRDEGEDRNEHTQTDSKDLMCRGESDYGYH